MVGRSARALLLSLAVAACTGGANKDDDVQMPYCAETVTVMSLDEASALGFSGQDLLDLATGTHDETLTWAEGGDTPLTLGVAHAGGEARFVDLEAVYPDDGEVAAIGVICDDRVEVDATVRFLSDDGAFDELWELALHAVSADAVTFYQELDPEGLTGTYDMDDDISEPDFDERSLWAAGSFEAAGAFGEIAGQISGEDDCADGTCSAWASEVAVGTWGAIE